ncbi:hypothetical protein Q3V23_01925 [Streptomyces sp. VNUA116]|uniref:hypothetical protein n=1 Tax=Streptomyces sp. VNUA116 TaxID=3062449 RepID=UPI0026748A23|nr:hypothetical protein [Streptomyces sp. VNUA116]WKU42923.1 hypothetical protein Q3V23_01925 [Streptomyces sp. VNUA116]
MLLSEPADAPTPPEPPSPPGRFQRLGAVGGSRAEDRQPDRDEEHEERPAPPQQRRHQRCRRHQGWGEHPETSHEAVELFARISRMQRVFDQHFKKLYEEFGLNLGEIDMLFTLRRSGPPYTLNSELHRLLEAHGDTTLG